MKKRRKRRKDPAKGKVRQPRVTITEPDPLLTALHGIAAALEAVSGQINAWRFSWYDIIRVSKFQEQLEKDKAAREAAAK